MKIVRFFSSDEINKAFNDADLDKNNYIDFNEFCITFKKFDDITQFMLQYIDRGCENEERCTVDRSVERQ